MPRFPGDFTVIQADFPLATRSDEGVVSHHDQRGSIGMKLTENIQHDLFIVLIEVTGRLL